MRGGSSLEALEAFVLAHGEPLPRSGRQELLEGVVNEILMS
jgi:xylose isomerase